MCNIREGGGTQGKHFVHVDIIDDADRLEKVVDMSQDFVIANHLLEHCEDPIGAIGNMLRVLKSSGILFLAVPDMRYTFDSERPVTTLEHLIRDHEEGAGRSAMEHFGEWAQFVEKNGEADVQRRAEELKEKKIAVHFHAWTQLEMLELILYLRKERGDFEIEFVAKNIIEMIIILRKNMIF